MGGDYTYGWRTSLVECPAAIEIVAKLKNIGGFGAKATKGLAEILAKCPQGPPLPPPEAPPEHPTPAAEPAVLQTDKPIEEAANDEGASTSAEAARDNAEAAATASELWTELEDAACGADAPAEAGPEQPLASSQSTPSTPLKSPPARALSEAQGTALPAVPQPAFPSNKRRMPAPSKASRSAKAKGIAPLKCFKTG